MEQLILQLKVLQATAFSLYLKAHNYHWNVTGPNFSEYHEFFGDFYNTVWESVDAYAEHARTLDSFVPGSLSRFLELTKVQDEVTIPSSNAMFARLFADNQIMLIELDKAHALAEASNKRGIINFLEGQIDYHEKMHWMLKSFNS